MGGVQCSCIKSENEQQSEFRPKKISIENNLNTNENILFNSQKSTVGSFNTFGEKGSSLSKFKSKPLSNEVKTPEIKIQTVVRAFLFRKKFYKEDGIKDKLTFNNDEILKKIDTDFIPEPLLEKDKIIKKDLNDDFLLKLETEESKKQKTARFKLKTDCLLTNYYNGEPCLYKGEININGTFNGYGELYFKNGKKYEGKFTDGTLNGYGRLIDLFGIVCYEGIFKDNQLLDGKGKIIKIDENGDKIIYEGDIKNMKKEGKGIEKNKDYTYLGSFSNDLKDGKGKIIYAGGDEFYEGDFAKGKMNGKGVYQWPNKCIYEGEFLDGQKHGKGIYKFPDGEVYEGEFVNNVREGFGELKKNGKIYKGNFKGGKKHGTGILIFQNGDTVEVEYENGKMINKKETKISQKSFTLKDNEQ